MINYEKMQTNKKSMNYYITKEWKVDKKDLKVTLKRVI